jgi:XTP/dITP diphosphohydrolase
MEGAVDGTITETERGPEGFGYDAVFEYSPEGKTFAEMSLPEKNRISHRGRALVALRARLEALLAQARAQSGSV